MLDYRSAFLQTISAMSKQNHQTYAAHWDWDSDEWSS